jgi:5-methylcytosine-specific restriction protein A
MRVCAEPGCPSLTDHTRCDTHRKQKRRQEDRRRPTATQRGYNKRWERTRRTLLNAMPYCECGAKATDVHHLDGKGPKGPRGHDMFNLKAMCHACHSRITATTQSGWAGKIDK